MIKSMTGFGKATAEQAGITVTVEVRSLNSKGADISLRVPSALRNYELELRNELSRKLERGKIDLSVFIESNRAEVPVEINVPLAKAYFDQLRNLSVELGIPLEDPLYHLLKFPDVLKSGEAEADESELKLIRKAIDRAVEELDKFRIAEGKSLQADFGQRIRKIGECLTEIIGLDAHRLKNIKERIRTSIVEMMGAARLDENRFEQELIYYIEKLDINEEKVRLRSHLDYFLQTLDDPSPGRKLSFISQEIGREINTIGAKAQDAHIQRLVVLMKDELEKIKEQSSNIL